MNRIKYEKRILRNFEKPLFKKWGLVILGLFAGVSLVWGQKFPGTIEEQDSLLRVEKNDSLYVIRAIALSRKIHREKHNTEKEYKYINKAIDYALVLEDTLLYARALDAKGLLYRFHQWYAQAVPLHIRAYKLVAEKGEGHFVNKMIYANNTGVAARYDQQYALAVEYYLKALTLAEEHDDLRDIAIASNGMGNALSNIPGREEEALSYFHKAIDAERKRNNDLGLAMNLLSISGYYIDQGDREEAFENLAELKAINESRKDTFGLALTNAAYGQAFEHLDHNFEKARRYYIKAFEAYKRINHHQKEARTLELLGDLEFRQSHYNQALQYYNRVLKIAKTYHYKSFLQKSHKNISEVKEKQNQLQEALDHLKIAQIYKDSIDLSDQKVKVEALRHQYDLTAKEDQIALLQKDQELKREQIAAQRKEIGTQRAYMIILGALVLLIVTLIILQYRRRKERRLAEHKLRLKEKYLLEAKYEKNLAQAEMLVSRMQINPHFIFNCLGAIKLLIQKNENKRAQRYLTTFSRFIRMVLEMPKQETISLAEELELIRYYLELEKKRFAKKMEFTINTEIKTCLEDIKIPPLLLQPFVENAIWHGLLPSPKESKKLKVEIIENENSTRITIDDNGVGLKNKGTKKPTFYSGKSKRKSMGMKITRERIRQFNQSYDMEIDLRVIDKSPDTGTRVSLIIRDKMGVEN